MKLKILGTALTGATMAFVSSVVLSQTTYDLGRQEYDVNCAACHGLTGKGDGPYKEYLTKSPSDLTTIAKINSGVFPLQRLHMVIDGRGLVPAHGTREMPIWGSAFRIKTEECSKDVNYDAEAFVRTRIVALIDYIHRLQTK
jgi:mono/diheme cytochrome c family protein